MTTPLDPTVAAVESDLEDFDRLKDLILTLLPYTLDDGEDPPNEANAEECVEYAADEIARLRSKNAALRAAMTEAASVMESIYESFRDGESRGCGPDSAVRLIDPADVDIGIGCWLAKHHALRSEDRKAQTHEPWGLWLAKDAARRRADAEGPIPEWTCACGAFHKTRLHYCNVCALPAPEKDGD